MSAPNEPLAVANLAYRGSLDDRGALASALERAGLSAAASTTKADLFARALPVGLAEADEAADLRPHAFFVPGRIEVLGKHTDYAGGRSVVAAAEQGFCTVAWPRDDHTVLVIDALAGDSVAFPLHAALAPRLGHWSNYPLSVARRLVRNFPGLMRGATIAFASDLPRAAGMSSSSALVVAMFLAIDSASQLSGREEFTRHVARLTDLAGYLGTMENGRNFGTLPGDGGVGTFGGSEDHTAILCSQAGHWSQYAYCPVRLERVLEMPGDFVFAIGASGVVAEKTGAAREKYNRASLLLSTIENLWHERLGRSELHLADALASSPDAAMELTRLAESAGDCRFTTDELLRRLEHFFTENEQIVPQAGGAIAAGDLATFGRLVDRSQKAAEELLGNQIPETSFLAASARRLGAAAASAFGAGFGGSVWAMIERGKADTFTRDWTRLYAERFPQHEADARFFVTQAGPAAFRVC